MKSCNRVIFAVLLSVGLSNGCGAETPDLIAAVQDVGLAQAAGVPPLGEGIPPVAGRGGDGAAVVTQIGGWSGGPGAVKWHGGQWVLPYSGSPGSTLANAACDVVPRADATALVELVSSNGQVLGSATVPATPPTVTIRAWPFVGTHTMGDGEQVVMRISPRALDGSWTDASKDMTVISCAMRSYQAITVPIAINGPRAGAAPGFQGDAFYMSGAIQSAVFQISGVPVGATIVGARVRVRDSASGPTRLNVVLYPSTDGSQGAPIATSSTSSGSGQPQTLSLSGLATTVLPLTTYSLYVNMTTGTAQVSIVGIDVDYLP